MSLLTRTRRPLARLGTAAVLGGLALSAFLPTAVAAPVPPAVQVVVVGTTGVQWEDVSPEATPALWELAGRGAVGSTVVRNVRSSTCPAEGWLSLSAGTRSGDTTYEYPEDAEERCRVLDEPSGGADAAVPAWDAYVTSAREGQYDAVPGTLGDILAEAGLSTAAFGPGAAIALASSAGEVPSWAPVDDALTPALVDQLAAADVVVVDAGTVRGETTDERASGVAAVDSVVADVLDALESSTTQPLVLFSSLADSARAPRLQVAAAVGPLMPGKAAAGLLDSASTRQPGYVLGYDLTRTIVDRAAPGSTSTASHRFDGSPLRADGSGASLDARVEGLRDDALRSVVVRAAVSPFYVLFTVANILLQVVVSLGIARATRSSAGDGKDSDVGGYPLRWLRAVRTVGLALAALPTATYLANLVPWWRSPVPNLTVTAVVCAIVGAVVALCLLPAVRRRPLGPLTVVTALTAVVLAVDVALGARLQLTSLMGTQALVAGRFYGFNNTAFTLFATSTVLLAAIAATPLVARGRRRTAAVVVALIGLVTVVLDGLPSIGADFGGPPALVPGFAVLVLLVLGVRLTWRRVLAVLAAGAVTVSLFAVLDWLRPEGERTHLGAFVQTVLDGGLWGVISRKLSQNASNLVGTPFTLIAVGAAVLVYLGVRRAGGRLEAPLKLVARELPVLGAGLIALLVVQTIAFALNDSGIIIPAIAATLALPLVVATFGRVAEVSAVDRPGQSASSAR